MVKHLVWEESWNMRQPRKHLPGNLPRQLRGLAVTAPSPAPSLSQHREGGTELHVAHSKQAMNGFHVGLLAAEILSALSKSLLCNADKWPKCQGNRVEAANTL